MKYIKRTIIEDKDLFKGFKSIYQVSKILGMSKSYLSRVVNDKVLMSEKEYLKIKNILDNIVDK